MAACSKCPKPSRARGLCSAHYQAAKAAGGPLPPTTTTNPSWTVAEDMYVLDHPELTAVEVGRAIGRAGTAVQKRREHLQTVERVDYHALKVRKEPGAVATRTLVAKTCFLCGLLLDASWFSRTTRRERHYWRMECRRCASVRVRRPRQRPLGKEAAHRRALNALTAVGATRNGMEWTTAEIVTLEDQNLSVLEMALHLKRTYNGVSTMRSRLNLVPLKRLSDPTQVQWYIALRPELAAVLDPSHLVP